MHYKQSLAAVALSAAPALATFGVNTYWGQNGVGDRLADYCASSSIDYVTLAFVNVSPINGGTAGLEGTNFAAHCASDVYVNNGADSLLLSDCTYIREDIQTCQSLGKKILLSIGGVYSSTSNYSLSATADALNFASDLFFQFGPVTGFTDIRPFDIDANTPISVDGFDFDIEVDFDNQALWVYMLEQLQSLFVLSDKDLIITAAPQCPLSEGYFDMETILEGFAFDKLWIQFYNNPACDATTSAFNYDDWVEWIAGTVNKDAELWIGLPGSEDAANSGYISPEAAQELIWATQDKANFGGVMLWDAYFASQNVVDGMAYYDYCAQALKCQKGDTSCTATTTTTSSSAAPTSSAPSSPSSSAPATTTTSSSTSSSIPPSSSAPATSTTSSSVAPSSSAPATSSTTSSSSVAPSSSAPATSSTVSSSSVAPSSSAPATSSTTSSSSVAPSSSAPATSSTTSSSSVAPSSSAPATSSTSSSVVTVSPSSSAPATSSSSVVVVVSSSSSAPATSSSAATSSSSVVVTSSSAAPTTSSTSVSMTTSTVYTTSVRTITSCASTVTNCPARTSPVVVTDTIALYTTVCPVTATEKPTKPATSTQKMTTSTVYSTTVRTITSCAPSVTNCPAKTKPVVVTDVIAVYTTVCPVEEAKSTQTAVPTYPASGSTGSTGSTGSSPAGGNSGSCSGAECSSPAASSPAGQVEVELPTTTTTSGPVVTLVPIPVYPTGPASNATTPLAGATGLKTSVKSSPTSGSSSAVTPVPVTAGAGKVALSFGAMLLAVLAL